MDRPYNGFPEALKLNTTPLLSDDSLSSSDDDQSSEFTDNGDGSLPVRIFCISYCRIWTLNVVM